MELRPGTKASYSVMSQKRNSEKFHFCCGFFVKFLMIFLCFMMVLVGHLYLRQLSVNSAFRTDNIKKEIEEIKAENRNLRNNVEKLTGWQHITRKIQDFKLPLRPAEAGQVTSLGRVFTNEQAARIPLTPIRVASAGKRSYR